jgi:hypothetical protein
MHDANAELAFLILTSSARKAAYANGRLLLAYEFLGSFL